ncbi:MAG: universal stress protein [Micrococcaceae bacterium]|nr:universal stress protein [Micrococcaceae bacterium]
MATKPVVVGIDGSENSKDALRWAVEFGRRYEAPVEAIAVWEMPATYGYVIIHGATGQELEEAARQMLADTVRDTVGDDAGVTQHVKRGNPSEVLIEASGSAQALVLGTRGHGAFARMVMGSVSQHCAANSKCPFTVVPPTKVKSKDKDKSKEKSKSKGK